MKVDGMADDAAGPSSLAGDNENQVGTTGRPEEVHADGVSFYVHSSRLFST